MIDLAAADVVFLSYDEPEAEANFARLQKLVPRARRLLAGAWPLRMR